MSERGPDRGVGEEDEVGRAPLSDHGGVAWDDLSATISTAVRFLDNVIDMNDYPVEAIARMTRQTRKIGLGLMGWADLLFQLGIPYDSEEALELADTLMHFVREHADAASEALAAERGPFPAWEHSIYGPEYEKEQGTWNTEHGVSTAASRMSDAHSTSIFPSPKSERGSGGEVSPEHQAPSTRQHASPRVTAAHSTKSDAHSTGIFPSMPAGRGSGGGVRPFRNSTRTTVAPTGTLSIIADCSGGIEPAFSLAFMRQHYLDAKRPTEPVQLREVNRVFEAAARAGGYYSDDLMQHLATGGSLRDRDDVPDEAKRVFVTAHDIAPEWHVRMQAAFQRHTDNAVSKTINFPRSATVEDVAAAYLLAYREGCKGITIYRDGSRTGQVLSHVADGEGVADAATVDGESAIARLAAGEPWQFLMPESGAHAPSRRRLADERQSLTHKFRVGEQEGYVTVGLFEDGTPGEIFVTISKEGSTIRGLMDSVAMLTSYSLQYGVPLRTLVDKFRGVHFEPAGFTSNPDIPQATSLVDYIFRWLELRFLEPSNGPAEEWRNTIDSVRPEPVEGRDGRDDPLALRAPDGRNARRRAAARRSATRSSSYVPPRPALPFSEIATGLLCPDCGAQLIFSEGCLTCRSCGFTRCG
jgi:ribonucleoside-diphosphate reductase alpha chain